MRVAGLKGGPYLLFCKEMVSLGGLEGVHIVAAAAPRGDGPYQESNILQNLPATIAGTRNHCLVVWGPGEEQHQQGESLVEEHETHVWTCRGSQISGLGFVVSKFGD